MKITEFKVSELAVEDVVPHSRKMVFLERLISANDDHVMASLRITDDTYFIRDGQVPAWVGIEYMAQSIAAYAGIQAKGKGEPVKVGLLLGSRRYTSKVSSFALGQTLFVSAKPLHNEESGLGVFECAIYPANENEECADEPWVTANLNVYQPHDVDAFLAGES
ncbi:hypothetical protein A9Q99_16015 [Gammaproteobacteria bacterium 45_16_T64]|nr:hypothetical protein A9Q99_16015 [Gammaproteobacteria bacterium 45_16_T64]